MFLNQGHLHTKTKWTEDAKQMWDLLPRTLPALRAGWASTTCCGRPVTLEEGMDQQGVGCVAREWDESWVSKTKFQQWKHEIQKALKYKCVTDAKRDLINALLTYTNLYGLVIKANTI